MSDIAVVSVLEVIDAHVERLLRDEVAHILDEVGTVDARLQELRDRDDEDSRVEYLVLSAYKSQLMEDLDELLGFAKSHNMEAVGWHAPAQQPQQVSYV